MARILVIDDDESVRLTVKVMLEAGGYDVALATDGEDGIRQFQAEQFDLVLCDVFMPRKEGLETVRELRSLSTDTPIITMTGGLAPDLATGSDPDFLRMTGAFGATAAIGKPFKLDQLLAVVRECLGAAPS